MKIDNIANIPKGAYEGYIWMSHSSEPLVIDGQMEELNLDPHINPFVIEAELYNPEARLSYSIKYVDGVYHAVCFNLNQVENETDGLYKHTQFVANRMKGISMLKFIDFWRPVKDPLCSDMEVLTPSESVFVGFIRKETLL